MGIAFSMVYMRYLYIDYYSDWTRGVEKNEVEV